MPSIDQLKYQCGNMLENWHLESFEIVVTGLPKIR